jgi:serine/threonine protein phosphatase PrpC
MGGKLLQSTWRVIGATVHGVAHVRAQVANQDAIAWLPKGGAGPPLVLVVSDGHGSPRSFRSAAGARLAVASATQVISEDLFPAEAADLSVIKRSVEERLPRRLVHHWREAVGTDLTAAPFTEKEWARLLEREGPVARKAVEANPWLAYGATLLAAMVTESFILYLQLGDGDILTVAEDGLVSRPLPRDERLLANETTSLCSREAWRDFRIQFRVASQPPALILLSTDGYANSFSEESGFLQVGADLLEIIRKDGLAKVQETLTDWLTEASEAGSGDDITLGVLCRLDALQRPATVVERSPDSPPTRETS